jgi:hypothetical protein
MRPVQIIVLGDINGEGPVAVVHSRGSDGFAPGVGRIQRIKAGHALLQPGLQGIVVGSADWANHEGVRGPAVFLVQLPPGAAAADGGPVQLLKPELPDLAGGHVAALGGPSTPQVPLQHQVPGLDVTAIEYR